MIEAKKLSMNYGPTLALEDVSFTAREHEVLGLLGPNGAGKSTLMRILTTYIYPTKGTATVCGFDITKDPLSARKIIGYLPENPPLYMDMRVDEFIDFVGRSRGLSGSEFKKRRDWVIEATQIAGVWKHLIYELSLGFKQRVGLAQALIHDPKVVILDEPTSGLDPMQIVGIRELIRGLAKDKTIIFSTHILQEASAISDRLMIIDKGRIIAQGTGAELRRDKSQQSRIRVSFKASRQEVEPCLKHFECVKATSLVEEKGSFSTFDCTVHSYDEAAAAINGLAREKGWTIRELSPKEASLEELFLGLFRKNG
jgi:ABC-2 type transport system ATP-binding protein